MGSELKGISLVNLRGPLYGQAEMNHSLFAFLLKLLGMTLSGVSPADIQTPGQTKFKAELPDYIQLDAVSQVTAMGSVQVSAGNSFTVKPKHTSSLAKVLEYAGTEC